MHVLVTGGAGFIGANLVTHLSQTGVADEVVVVDDLSTGIRGNLAGLNVAFLHGSILDPALLDRAMDGSRRRGAPGGCALGPQVCR